MKNNSLAEIAAYLKGQQQLTLICHARPDGDTLGCAFGLKNLLMHHNIFEDGREIKMQIDGEKQIRK